MFGDGPKKKEVQKYIDTHPNLKKNVKIVGNLSYNEILKEYSQATALIMPSLRETTGSVLAEAISNNCPIIALDSFGAHTILNNSNLLYVGNNLDEIKQSLKNSLYDSMKCDQEAIYNENIINSILWKYKIKKYKEIYQKCLDGKKNER